MNYAYVHCKPDGTPFYVGKGKLRRAKYVGERNPHHASIVKKYGAKNILVGMLACSTEEAAYELEKGMIKCFQRVGIKLANFTAGGEGGLNPTETTRKKLSDAAKKRGVSAACHEARVLAKRGIPLTKAHKQQLSYVAKGRVFTEQHRRNISDAAKKRGMPVSVLTAARLANIGRVQPKEERVKRGASISISLRKNGRVLPVYVDGVLFSTLKDAAKYIGVCSAAVLYALRNSGTVKGHTVRITDGL